MGTSASNRGNMWKIMLMYHTYCWGSYFYLSWMPTYLQKGRGFTGDEMKIYAMLPFLAGAVGNIVGRLRQRHAGASGSVWASAARLSAPLALRYRHSACSAPAVRLTSTWPSRC